MNIELKMHASSKRAHSLSRYFSYLSQLREDIWYGERFWLKQRPLTAFGILRAEIKGQN
jgi:hypothetical protein